MGALYLFLKKDKGEKNGCLIYPLKKWVSYISVLYICAYHSKIKLTSLIFFLIAFTLQFFIKKR